MLGALIKSFWPGLYTVVPDGQKKLALHWVDYEAADIPGFGKASLVVINRFWVRHISRVLFIVRDPTVRRLMTFVCMIAGLLQGE